MTKENLKLVSKWVSNYSWEENEARTDAVLKVTVSPYVDGSVASGQLNKLLHSITKDDIVTFVESLIAERIDVYTIDSISITLDGDAEDTELEIKSEIHLAE